MSRGVFGRMSELAKPRNPAWDSYYRLRRQWNDDCERAGRSYADMVKVRQVLIDDGEMVDGDYP